MGEVDLDRAWPPGRRWPEDLLSDEIAVLLLRYGTHIVAERRSMSERSLRRGFQRHGVGLLDHVHQRRRVLALDLLSTSIALSTIAGRLGFSSSQAFARFVRRELGSTAGDLRGRLRPARLSTPGS